MASITIDPATPLTAAQVHRIATAPATCRVALLKTAPVKPCAAAAPALVETSQFLSASACLEDDETRAGLAVAALAASRGTLGFRRETCEALCAALSSSAPLPASTEAAAASASGGLTAAEAGAFRGRSDAATGVLALAAHLAACASSFADAAAAATAAAAGKASEMRGAAAALGAARPHRGVTSSTERLLALLEDGSPPAAGVLPRGAFAATPHAHGAAADAVEAALKAVEKELGAAEPWVVGDHAGAADAFDAAPLALAAAAVRNASCALRDASAARRALLDPTGACCVSFSSRGDERKRFRPARKIPPPAAPPPPRLPCHKPHGVSITHWRRARLSSRSACQESRRRTNCPRRARCPAGPRPHGRLDRRRARRT